MLDPVRRRAVAAGRPVGVERGAYRAVSNGVRDALEAGAGEARDRGRVVVGIGPERELPEPARVRLVEPRRSRLDHAVDEELRDAPAPEDPALVAQAEPRLLLGNRRARVDRERHHEPRREVAARLELAAEAEGLGRAVHAVHARQPAGVHPRERVGVEVELLGVGRLRDRRSDEVVGARLAQLARRDAIDADHLGRVRKRARARDAAGREPGARREHGVEVEERQVAWSAAHRVVDRRRGDRPSGEDRVLEREPAHPLAGAEPIALGAQRGLHLGQGRESREVDPARVLGTVERVLVRVDEAGRDHRAAAIDHLGRRPAETSDVGLRADRRDGASADCERNGFRRAGIEGADAGADEGELRVHSSHPWCSSSSSRQRIALDGAIGAGRAPRGSTAIPASSGRRSVNGPSWRSRKTVVSSVS